VPTSTATSFCEVAAQPTTLGLTLIAIAIGIAGSAVIAILMAFAILGTAIMWASRPSVRARLAIGRHRRDLLQRREQRETRLEEANVRRDRISVLTRLADAIAGCDPDAAERLELEALLDRYAEIATALARCRRARDATSTPWLRTGPSRIVHCNRTGACRDVCAALEEDLAVIEDLFVMLAEQTALRSSGLLVHESRLERR
jgi:hypothetical protein